MLICLFENTYCHLDGTAPNVSLWEGKRLGKKRVGEGDDWTESTHPFRVEEPVRAPISLPVSPHLNLE